MNSIPPLVSRTGATRPPPRRACAPQPRLLVCAPSNGAVDEILSRLLRDGLLGPGGRGVSTRVVRIGTAPAGDNADRPSSSDDPMSAQVAAAGWDAQVTLASAAG